MNLVIRAHTLKNETLSQAITGHFDERGGTIGRSDTNTLTLPDPERHISRLQAEVWFSNGSFSIRNVGSANSITVNGRPVNPGEGSTLSNGDEILVGAYAMRATISAFDEPATQAPMAVDARTVIKASATETRTNPRLRVPTTAAGAAVTTSASNPFADLLGSGVAAAKDDPFAGLMGGQPANPPTTAVHVRVPSNPSPLTTDMPAPARPMPPVSFPPPPPPPVASAPAARLPDDFDPFADLGSATAGSKPSASDPLASFMGRQAAPAASASPAGSPLPADLGLGDLIGSPSTASSSGSIDSLFGLNASASSAGSDPLAAFLAPSKSPSGPAAENKDPMAMFGTPPSASTAPALPADFDHTPEMKSAYVPPAVVPAPPPAHRPVPVEPPPAVKAVVPPPPVARPATPPAAEPPARPAAPQRPVRAEDLVPTATVPGVRSARHSFDSAAAPLDALPTPSASTDALWAAFCEGAGVNIKLPQGLTPELMKVIGQVLHHAVDGTIKLVAVRAAAKQELKADVTVIQARNNNPLKFSPDAGVAIEQLLQPPMRGFMMGPTAVNDVMDDLLGHAIGTMAGMRAALTGVLERFEPSQLEGKLAGNSVLDTVLPMNRRAKLWELYLQHYKRIRDDAQDDFHDLFGKAFIEAYEEQLDRLDAARHPI